MKLSIKFKLPLIMLVVFILNAAALILFYRLFIDREVKSGFEAQYKNLSVICREIASGISTRYPDMENIKNYVREEAEKKKLKISINDSKNNLLFSAYHKDTWGALFREKEFVLNDGRVQFIIEVERSHALQRILGLDLASSMIYFSVSMLFIILLLLVAYLHHSIVYPLTLLEKNIENINYKGRTLPLALHRNDEIGALSSKFADMVKKLETAYNQQIDMISSISHDLKTPLTSIMGYIERLLLGSVKTEEKKQEYYKIVYKKSQDIENLIEEFTDFAKNEMDCARIEKTPVNVREFYNSICSEYSQELQVFNVDFEFNSDVNEDIWMEVDIKKIRRVFANLISNSLKYSSGPLKVTLRCTADKNSVTFSVEDNGKGVPPEELSSIFNKFYRVDKARSPGKGGTGLGLAICKSIIEGHGGEIKAYSACDNGLGITFALPLA
jgi:signal transduction histidine kinase